MDLDIKGTPRPPLKVFRVQMIDVDTDAVIAELYTLDVSCVTSVAELEIARWVLGSRLGRPTWTDAMAHCTDDVRALWRAALVLCFRDRGQPVPPDLLDDSDGPPAR
jgi:hypothetical protein